MRTMWSRLRRALDASLLFVLGAVLVMMPAAASASQPAAAPRAGAGPRAELWKNGPPHGLPQAAPGSGAVMPGDSAAGAASSAPAAVDPVGSLINWTRIAYQSFRDGNYEIYTARADGSAAVRITSHPAADVLPNVDAPTSRIVFVSNRDGNWEIYSCRLDGSDLRRLTDSPASDSEPEWSPDGSQIAFSSDRSGQWNIYVMNADGSNVRRLTSGLEDGAPSWSPDGGSIAFIHYFDKSHGVVYRMAADGSAQRSISHFTLVYPDHTSWSPNGRYVAASACFYGWAWSGLYVIDLADNSYFTVSNPTDGRELWMGGWSPDSTKVNVTVALWQVVDKQWVFAGGALATVRVRGFQPDPLPNPTNLDFNPDWYTTDLQAPNTSVEPLPDFSPASGFKVSWNGVDPGGAGIAAWGIEVRVDGGPWQTFKEWDPFRFAQYSGAAGSQVEFRSRGLDLGLNMEAWPPVPDATTRLYASTAAGRVYDVRGRPVPGTTVDTSPAAIVPVTSGETGDYVAHLAASGALTLTASHPAYGRPPATIRTAEAAARADFSLPPVESYVAGGDFEGPALDPAWQLQGDPLPRQTTSERHSGSAALVLGQPAGLSAAQVVATGNLARLAVGGNTVNLLTGRALLNVAPEPGSEILAGIDAGNGVHVVFKDQPAWPNPLTYRGPSLAEQAAISTLRQTVTIPAGSHQPTLGFYVKGEPAAVERLRVSVEADGASQPLALGLTGQGWQHAWAGMAPWAGKTVTLCFELAQPDGSLLGQVWLDEITLGSWLTPVIDRVSVDVKAGGTLTIDGSNFVGAPAVRIDDQPLTLLQASETVLVAALPDPLPLGRHTVWVVNPGGQPASRTEWIGQGLFLPRVTWEW